LRFDRRAGNRQVLRSLTAHYLTICR
jgi:hypothetical protein